MFSRYNEIKLELSKRKDRKIPKCLEINTFLSHSSGQRGSPKGKYK